jgi:hypothetical protein
MLQTFIFARKCVCDVIAETSKSFILRTQNLKHGGALVSLHFKKMGEPK